jgi:exosortase/archaeosortase family protein
MIEKAIKYLTEKRFWPLVDVFIFVVITYGFHELWWTFSGQIAGSPAFTAAASWLAGVIYNASAWIDVHVFGIDVLLYSPNVIYFKDNNTAINVNESCSGFKQMWQVLVLFLLFPGPWKQKLWYIPMGMLSMFLFNIVRIVALSFAMLYWPQHWDFIHLWVLRPVYYFIIFVLWVIWVEKYGGMKRYFDKPKPLSIK